MPATKKCEFADSSISREAKSILIVPCWDQIRNCDDWLLTEWLLMWLSIPFMMATIPRRTHKNSKVSCFLLFFYALKHLWTDPGDIMQDITHIMGDSLFTSSHDTTQNWDAPKSVQEWCNIRCLLASMERTHQTRPEPPSPCLAEVIYIVFWR